MTDEIKDGFVRLKELAEHIKDNIKKGKLSLANAQVKLMIANLDVLESEIELTEN